MGILIFWQRRRHKHYQFETTGGDIPLATDASHFTRVDEVEGQAQLLSTTMPMTEKEDSPALVEALVEMNPDAVEAELEDGEGEEEVKSPDGFGGSGQATPTSGDADTTF